MRFLSEVGGGVVSGSQSSGGLASQLDFDRNVRLVQCLAVCIAENEGNVVNALLVHVLDGVSTSSSYTDDFDDFRRVCRQIELYDVIHNVWYFIAPVPRLR